MDAELHEVHYASTLTICTGRSFRSWRRSCRPNCRREYRRVVAQMGNEMDMTQVDLAGYFTTDRGHGRVRDGEYDIRVNC